MRTNGELREGIATPTTLPSGQQSEIHHGDLTAVITEVGASLRSLTFKDVPLLWGFTAQEMCSGGRGQVLAPWPNRLGDGRYVFKGTEHQLPLSEPQRQNAIHGLVRWGNWYVTSHSANEVRLSYVLHPQPGYPFTLALSVTYTLDSNGLKVTLTATNRGQDPLPYGCGFHPYFTVGTSSVDDITVTIPASRRLVYDERLLPTGATREVGGTDFDFRTPRAVGRDVIDACYTNIAWDADDRARVIMTSPDRTSRVTMWMDKNHQYLVVFTGDTLDPPSQRKGLAIEPMTCAPNALQNGHGLRVIEPTESLTTTWGIVPDL